MKKMKNRTSGWLDVQLYTELRERRTLLGVCPGCGCEFTNDVGYTNGEGCVECRTVRRASHPILVVTRIGLVVRRYKAIEDAETYADGVNALKHRGVVYRVLRDV